MAFPNTATTIVHSQDISALYPQGFQYFSPVPVFHLFTGGTFS